MIILKNCLQYISNGMLLRTVATIISIYVLKDVYNKNDNSILLILPILLAALDSLDTSLLFPIMVQKMQPTNCTRKFMPYQIADKIIDILSYILVYVYFYDDLRDSILEFFIIYRLFGVILFIMTYNKYFLVGFFDMVKEYMLYKYFFGAHQQYLIIVVILKVCFEYVLHMKINV